MRVQEKALADGIYSVFTKQARDTADKATAFINSLPKSAKLKKSAEEESPNDETSVTFENGEQKHTFWDDLSDFLEIAALTEKAIISAGNNGYRLTIDEMGFGKPGPALNLLPPPAYRAHETPDFLAQFAKDRSAEMVGRKFVDGKLVENPNAKWVITDTTRNNINKLIQDVASGKLKATDLRQAIIDSEAFSKERAEKIARSELVNADGYTALMAMYESRAMGLDVVKGWDSTTESCPVCLGNTADGYIALEEEFSSGHQHPTAHPDCECSLVSKVRIRTLESKGEIG